MIDILLSAELAKSADGKVVLSPQSGFPPVDEFLLSLIEEKPHLASENRLLALLNSAIRSHLESGAAWDPQGLIGVNRLNDLLLNTTTSKRAISFGRQLLESTIAELPSGHEATILVVSEASIQRISDWSAQLSDKQVLIRHVRTSELADFLDDGLALASNNEYAPVFDMMLSLDGLPINETAPAIHEKLAKLLRPQAGIVAFQQSRSFFKFMLLGDDPSVEPADALKFGGAEESYSSNELKELFDSFGVNVFEQAKLPLDLGSRTAVILGDQPVELADKPTSAPVVDDLPSTRLDELLKNLGFVSSGNDVDKTENIGIGIYSNLPENAAAEETTGQHHVISVDLIENADEADENVTSTITECILQLSEHIKTHNGNLQRITFIIPNGANYIGNEQCDPSQVAIWNLCRTIQNEYAHVSINLLDLGSRNISSKCADLLTDILSQPFGETEAVFDETGLHVLRAVSGVDVPNNTHPVTDDRKLTLQAPLSGRLDQLSWHEQIRSAPAANQVEIEILQPD